MTDPAVTAFVDAVSGSIRAGLYTRLKDLPLPPGELTALIARVTRDAVGRAYVAELAGLAVAGGAAALAVDDLPTEDPEAPDLPEVLQWKLMRDGAPQPIRAILFE